MSQKTIGKRATSSPQEPNSKRLPLFIILALVVVLVAAIGISCAAASSRTTIFPGTSIAGIPVGGLTEEEAIVKVRENLAQRYAGQEMVLKFPDFELEKTLSIEQVGTSVDVPAAAHAAYLRGRENGVLGGGLTLLTSIVYHKNIEPSFSLEDDTYLLSFLVEVASQIDDPVVEHHYEIKDDQLVFTIGHAGYALDQEAIYKDVLSRLETEDYSELTCASNMTNPASLDWDTIYNEIYVEAADAKLDKETYRITDHVVGVRFDKDAAMAAVAEASPDETVSIPLIYTQPEVTTAQLTATLFHDVIGTCTTTVGGSSNRASNVKLAASFVDETILLPGEIFSYNGVVGSRQASRGFLPAPAYVGGETVNEIGGGICQLSSTIYLASMRANMEIVERYNHSYAVGYVPDGMDATVYYKSLDFRFKNDKDRPIKITCSMQGRTLTVNIYGTKENDNTVKITNKVLSTSPYKTIYQEDASIKSGKKVKTTGYTGKTVETYRSIYDANGNLISSKLEAVSRYKTRNKIVLVPVGSQEGSVPTKTPDPTATPKPTATSTPKPTSTSTPTPKPTATPTPQPDPTPVPLPESA
jgi:vancomycin resistance protein YoaR